MQAIKITLPSGGAYVPGDRARVELDGNVIGDGIDLAPGGTAFAADIDIASPPLVHGLHTADVTTIDGLGNETATATKNVFVNTGPTAVRDLAFAQVEPSGAFTFAITPPLEWE